MTRVRIVGAGRAGASFRAALADVGWSVDAPLGRDDDLADVAHGAELLLVAVPDAAVADVAAAIEPDGECVVAHVSGSLGLAPLSMHPRRAVLHPLVALPDDERAAYEALSEEAARLCR